MGKRQIAVGFDFDHTLGIDNKLERCVGTLVFSELLNARGRRVPMEIIEHALDVAVERFRRYTSFFDTSFIDEALHDAFVGLGGEADCLLLGELFRRRVLEAAPEFVRALPGTREMLDGLRSLGVRCAILTNGWSPLQERKAELIGFPGPVLVSESIGVGKPDPEAFARLAEVLGLECERWYVGDDPVVDIGGALAANFRAVWFDWEQRIYPADVPAPTATIRSPAELLALIQGSLANAANPAP
ncbi:MAG TPA: HAD family hydrolase [Candidatus Baltobacteraceae bacterium]|jgi:HAD superfamily hydrolase (TIGR01509 family)|nr:HAD family hydrolase [Candidatus Baltobacteraceae bacterium]